jgi:hypothetical protein
MFRWDLRFLKIMLLLVGNTSIDYKIKPPMVNYSENPQVPKGYSTGVFPDMWSSNKKQA